MTNKHFAMGYINGKLVKVDRDGNPIESKPKIVSDRILKRRENRKRKRDQKVARREIINNDLEIMNQHFREI